MQQKKYKGVVVPAVTPLASPTTNRLSLDAEAVERMFANFRQHQVMPFILGTTGEAASLPQSIKQDYLKVAARVKQSGDVLYAGISSNIMEESGKYGRCACIVIPAWQCLSFGAWVVERPVVTLCNGVQLRGGA